MSAEPVVIQHPVIADFLMHPRSRKFLEPFMKQACSASQAAKIAQVSLSLMHYHVTRMLEWGLIEVVQEKQRSGRTIRVYQATRAYFVPFDLLPQDTLEQMMLEVSQPWNAQFVHHFMEHLMDLNARLHRWGWLIRSEDQGVSMSPTPDAAHPETLLTELLKPEAPALWATWAPVWLDFQEAKQLQQELHMLLQKHAAKSGSQQHLLHLALTPLRNS